MKVVHFEGGLGNQMASYAIYTIIKEIYPNETIYADTYVYDIQEANEVISMWNGYELDKVFGIDIPNIKELFSEEEIKKQIEIIRASEFWNNGWNYANVFIKAMEASGIEMNNAYSNLGDLSNSQNLIKKSLKSRVKKIGASASNTYFGYKLKKLIHQINSKLNKNCGKYLLEKKIGNYFYDITLDFMKSQILQEKFGQDVRKGLCFVEKLDSLNQNYLDQIRKKNSVSIHVRRTDYLKFNNDCYKYGYFNKSVNYIKKKVSKPAFFIFSDDLEWCKNNLENIGLTKQDEIVYVESNSGKKSYMDMYLMSNCKHNIITKSSFGWWASFLNLNERKITCCQVSQYVSTNKF